MKTKIKAAARVLLFSAMLVGMSFFDIRYAEAFQPWKSGQSQFLFGLGEAGPDDKSHQSITEDAIDDFAMNDLSRPASKGAKATIVHDNGFVDFWKLFSSEAHFDDQSILAGQGRLADLLNTIQASMNGGHIPEARKALGQALHTVQDFYSHSNWVETHPNGVIYAQLGRTRGIPGVGIASGATCLPCPSPAPSPPICEDNLITSVWTSGYFSLFPHPFCVGAKPAGKCSHGGSLDRTGRCDPIGGINKDTSNSPHGDQHLRAAGFAYNATLAFLRNLEADHWLTHRQVIRLLCDGPSLVICIDTTGSMGDIIDQVKDTAIAIVNQRRDTDEEPSQYVLAPFNDPDVPPAFVTADADEFNNAISNLFADGGGDCPELAVTGLINGVAAASASGELFLFTDADAKDYYLAPIAQNLALENQMRLFLAIFGSCDYDAASKRLDASDPKRKQGQARVPSVGVDPVYQAMAEATSGQVFSLDRSEAGQITTLLDNVSRSRAVNLLSIHDSLPATERTYTLPIDNTMTTVTFAVSGTTSVTLRRPDGSIVQNGDPGVTITLLSTVELVSIANPATGNWQIDVSVDGAFSITVSGEATFDIKSFDFVHEGGETSHEPGLFRIDGFPVSGQANIVSAELTGGFNSAQFEFRSPSGATLQVLTLQQGVGVASNVFVGSVTPPDTPGVVTPFVVYATGLTGSGTSFQRLVPGTIRAQSVTVTAPPPADLLPGTSTTLTFRVQNLGLPDTFHIEGSDDKGFLTSITPTDVSLGEGETAEVTVVLQTPTDATLGTSDTLTVTATGGSGAHNFAVVVSDVGIAPRLGNISTRAFVQTGDNVMIGGFIVQGTESKRVIIRAIGPELTQYGVPNAMADPTLELHDGTGALIASNDNWQTTIIGGIITQDQVQDIQNSGLAPGDGRESAIIADLPPGNYTAIVRGVNGTTGVALVEVYDLSPETSSILGNISTRSFVQTGDNVMIGGFIVKGTEPKKVIVRAIGPELSQYGVPDPMQDPTLELHDGTGALIASNDNWQTTVIGGIIDTDQVQDIQNSGHAPGDARESAIIATLPAGNYTAIVRGVSNTTGVALVEVYDLNPGLDLVRRGTQTGRGASASAGAKSRSTVSGNSKSANRRRSGPGRGAARMKK